MTLLPRVPDERAPRRYHDPCGIARALDQVGERWALLVARELLLGPRRFGELKEALAGVSPNVLSLRLQALEVEGVVERGALPAPGRGVVYQLTARGRELEPVLLALARWGARATPVPPGPMSVDALLVALAASFQPAVAGRLRRRVGLRLGAREAVAEVARGSLRLRAGPARGCDAVLSCEPAVLRALVAGQLPVDRALRAGALVVDGDPAVARRFLGLFRA